MPRRATFACCIAAALFALLAPAHAQLDSTPQLQFTAEDNRVHDPVHLSNPVFLALTASLAADRPGDAPPTRKEFSASALPCSLSKRQLYLVQGTGSLHGANTTLFWVVEEDNHRHTARILWRGQQHSIRIHYLPYDLYPEIETSVVTQGLAWTAVYAYADGEYRLIRSNDTENQKELDRPDK